MKVNLFLPIDIQKSISSKIPDMFDDLNLDKGDYVYGTGSTPELDRQGEKVILEPDVALGLENGDYTKAYMEHETKNFPAGMIKFSRIMDDGKHIILMKLNDAHPNFKNILGSVKNGAIDSFSVAGDADRSMNHKGERIAKIKQLREVSLTSMPANPSAGIIGSFSIAKSFPTSNGQFFKSLHGGIEILDNQQNKEVATMPDNVTLDSLSNTVADIAGTVTKGFEDMSKAVSALTERSDTMEKNWTDFQKSIEDDSKDTTEEKDEAKEVEKKEKETKEETKEPEDVQKSMSDLKEQFTKLEKTLIQKRSPSDVKDPLATKPSKGTPLVDGFEAEMRSMNSIGGGK